MALVNCPDCGRSVSDAATMCIGCGRPMVAVTSEVSRSIEAAASHALPQLLCDKCGGRSFKKVSLVYEESRSSSKTASTGFAVGFAGTSGAAFGLSESRSLSQTDLARRVAPPIKKKTPSRGVPTPIAAVFYGLIASAIGTPLVGVIVAAFFLYFGSRRPPKSEVEAANSKAFAEAFAAWDRRYLCTVCGETKSVPQEEHDETTSQRETWQGVTGKASIARAGTALMVIGRKQILSFALISVFILAVFSVIGGTPEREASHQETNQVALAQPPKADEGVKIVHRLSSDTLGLRIETTLPPTTKAIVTVQRSYWAVGDSAEYSHDYFSQRGPLSDFSKERSIKVADSVWQEVNRKKNAEWQPLGIAQKVSKISDEIEVSVRLVDDPSKDYVVNVSKPFGGKMPAEVHNLHPLELEVGYTYRVGEDTPLAPSLEAPKVPVEEMLRRFKTIPKGATFTIISISKPQTDPWYQVETKQGKGWINPVALMGQRLEFVK